MLRPTPKQTIAGTDVLEDHLVRFGLEGVSMALEAVVSRIHTAMTAAGWEDISTAPRDGTWFVTACFGYGEPDYEVGRYQPIIYPRYVEAGDGLYRKEEEQIYDWQGFSNFGRATHWMPLPPPPKAIEEE